MEPPQAQQPPLDIKELLLGEGPRFDDIVPQRGGWKTRAPIDFSGAEFDEGHS